MANQPPEQIHRAFTDAFNDHDIDRLMARYEPDCAIVPQPGALATGADQVREVLQGLLSLNGQIELRTTEVITVGDLAFLSCRWVLDAIDADDKPMTIGGTTAEVARRQPDGSWLYVIDHPVFDQSMRPS